MTFKFNSKSFCFIACSLFNQFFFTLTMKENEKVYDAVVDSKAGSSQSAGDEVKLPSLPFCIAMDLIGMASYIIPGIGESADLVWAPISGFIFMRSFGGMTGKIGGLINLVEEAVPFLDVVPTFTIGYFYAKHQSKKK